MALTVTYESIDVTPRSLAACEATAEYDFRIEPVVDGKFPTVRRFRLWYRDYGTVTFTFTVSGILEDGTSVNTVATLNSASPIVLSSGAGSKTMKQVYLDLLTTVMCPQVKITLAVNAGILDIIRLTGIGEMREIDII